jgi:DNA-binding MarR family transcriptional regulator
MTANNWNLAAQRRPDRIIPVESHLAYWLHYVGCRVFHKLRLGALELGVTAAESVLLRKLYEDENDAMPIRLALRLGLSRGYISRLAVRLEAKGFIHRNKSPSDRRVLTLQLTDQGRALMFPLSELADQTNGRLFALAGEAAHDTIERVMKWVVYRHRFRILPRYRCRMRKYRYLHLGADWDVEADEDEDEDEDEDGFS